MKQVEVLLPTAVPHGFDYRVPAEMTLKAGDILSVPFGSGQSLGVVWGEGKAKLPPGKIKEVAVHYNDIAPLSDTMRQFVEWAAWYNCALKGSVLKMVLPMADLTKEGRVSVDIPESVSPSLAALSAAQQYAAQNLSSALDGGFGVTLLDGVTGSGKTEVYFEVIANVLRRPNHQCLVLLPEIALSVQWLARFKKRFGFMPILWNSEVSPARKRASWQAIAKGDAPVVVGARSALFLPYRKLALIIVDEEHDGSYKQEEGVMYHARDMAVARARFEKIPAVLVSATPSLETYHNTKQGKYAEVTLPLRHNDALMPHIQMIDMRQMQLDRDTFVAPPLRKALADALASGHQSLLFLNRRGYAPLMLCRACGYRFQCPNCTGWMVVHQKRVTSYELPVTSNPISRNSQLVTRNYLHCHHCDYRISLPPTCPGCGAEESLHACGPGVERLLEEVTAFLPQARIKVMASDSAGGQAEVKATIQAMIDHEIDILIGTQMVAKGHHFAGLAMVGVIDADLGLAGGDLRAAEHTYQLLHQLSGRAGREAVSGTVYIQSYLPEHPVMQALLGGDRDAFLSAELQARNNAHMPPFTRLGAVIVEGTKEEAVIATARALASSFPSRQPPTANCHLYGPAPAPLYMLRGKYRYRLLVKANRQVNLPDLLSQWVEGCTAPASVRVKIDIDPQSFL